MGKSFKWLSFLGVSVFILSACAQGEESVTSQYEEKLPTVTEADSTSKIYDVSEGPITITAKQSSQSITMESEVDTWAYDGIVPGPQIRATVGETIDVTLENELPDPVTIHWHGLPVPNNMDGIPGVTQNAVKPGESFEYKFEADVPGTYWYHSHQDGSNQLDKGLYGTIIVEDESPSYDKDFTLVLDEWQVGEEEADSSMEGMDMGEEVDSSIESMDMSGEENMAEMYDTFLINGKSGESIPEMEVEKGDRVRLRFVNAGNMAHKMDIHGQEFQIVATDGQPINNPATVTETLIEVAPGERYDVEFTVQEEGEWFIECHGNMEQSSDMKTKIRTTGFTGESTDTSNQLDEFPVFDFTSYGEIAENPFSIDDQYDVEYRLDLNNRTVDGQTEYTINDKVFPDTDTLEVEQGDRVKVTLVNSSETAVHPMHLHGVFFQVISKNGEPLMGAPVFKDTINVKPGEEYEIAFLADNPGDWMFHCHDLHHAAAGMVTLVKYKGFEPVFTPDPTVENKPE
ncbi:multicopper oxidase family protein [Aquibacillus salsiterrae]|uniref:Multicopper oxidase family protein n=1 Tax=Aquibacillus salsiterrae TaxID=2950439 RepID=A0A9X4AFS0_9BACI|nr:multicopper oxidase family protein [Aquibacillus salsiterrae]MDC3418312.1 multicopper oxidase family protein [Aquibacillus salsiterrae]